MPKIKICGLTLPSHIEAVNAYKPDYIGFVFAPSRRRVSPDVALKLRESLSPDIVPAGVFVDENPDEILALVSSGTIEIIQLHGDEDEKYIEALKSRTNKPIIKAQAVTKTEDIQRWANSAAEYLLLDYKGGGTGQTFDWNLVGDSVGKPYFLAGGLHSTNVGEALKTLKTPPYAVDVSSGVETQGQKDPVKIRHFIEVIRNGN